ncbi:hypothetical protein [Novosphingobium sp. AAP83]|uniref:RipA family octameric membrane protein n=1 Tax=Novosphingobium sp. AAP83 TaxID=1523425 RepID=UPI0012FC2AEF|nr:hypothetical protein [Novosphingobium sp. AAP83]
MSDEIFLCIFFGMSDSSISQDMQGYEALSAYDRAIAIENLDFDQKIQILTVIHNHYMMDIEQIWKRSTIFLFLSSALLAIIFSKDSISDPLYRIIFSMFGLLTSLTWICVSKTSYNWIKIWRSKFIEVESFVNPFLSFCIGEMKRSKWKDVMGRPQIYSIILSGISVLSWSVIFGLQIYDYKHPELKEASKALTSSEKNQRITVAGPKTPK